jgi:predicted NBD/HSP70 family sugar kinase
MTQNRAIGAITGGRTVSMRRGTNLPAVGGFNQAVILDLIRREPAGMSRVELAERSGLSSQTVSNMTKRLLDDGMIVEAGRHISGRGQPRVILQLDPTSRMAIGVHLDPTVITYVALNLRGDVIAHARERTPEATRPDEVITSIAESISALIRSAGLAADRILGIGFAAPGPIDMDRGVIVDPPLLEGWRDVPLRDALAEATGLPVVLEKDVNAAVVAELWTRPGEAHDHFAFFYLGTGIGIGLAVDGEVVRGATGNAGDGGTIHVTHADLPPRRRSDMIGHLATPQYLVSQAAELGALETAPDLHDLAAVDDAYSELVRRADRGEAPAVKVMARAAALISAALVSVVNLLDIDEIVFGGPAWARAAPLMRSEIVARINDSPERGARHHVTVRDATVGEDVAAVGAACLVLDRLLSPRPSTLLIGHGVGVGGETADPAATRSEGVSTA